MYAWPLNSSGYGQGEARAEAAAKSRGRAIELDLGLGLRRIVGPGRAFRNPTLTLTLSPTLALTEALTLNPSPNLRKTQLPQRRTLHWA